MKRKNKLHQITSPMHPSVYLFLAIWFGLITGLSEGLFLGASKFYLHRIIFLGSDYIWMTPLANLIVFAPIGLIFTLLARRSPRIFSLRVAVFLYTFVGLTNLYFLKPKLYLYAALLLIIGIAVQAARYSMSRSSGFYSLVYYTVTLGLVGKKRNPRIPDCRETGLHSGDDDMLPSRRQFLIHTGVTIGTLVLAKNSWDLLRENRTLAALPPITKPTPNVLLIVLDTVRAKSLSLYGYERSTTPQLEQLAKTAVVFDQAFSTSPWTIPSHGTMFTGRFPHELTADWLTPMDGTYPTVAEVLRSRGYVTAGFVGNTTYCSSECGLNRGFSHYEDYPVSFGQIMLSGSFGRKAILSWGLDDLFGNYKNFGRKSVERVNEDFLHWVSHKTERRPFFAFLNYFDAHWPYLSPKEFQGKFSTKLSRGYIGDRCKLDTLSPEQVRDLKNAYEGAVAYVDHHIGRLHMELEERGLLENTVVIITADHGELFGEHNLVEHGSSLYLPLLHVPLIILFPSFMSINRRIQTWVNLRDLPATVLDILGMSDAFAFPGESLARYWNADSGTTSVQEKPLFAEIGQALAGSLPAWYPAMQGPMKSVLFEGMHYIKNLGTDREELYDLKDDLLEEHDLAVTGEGRLALDLFRKYLKMLSAGM